MPNKRKIVTVTDTEYENESKWRVHTWAWGDEGVPEHEVTMMVTVVVTQW